MTDAASLHSAFCFNLFRVDVAVYSKGEFVVSRRSVKVVCVVLAGAKQSQELILQTATGCKRLHCMP